MLLSFNNLYGAFILQGKPERDCFKQNFKMNDIEVPQGLEWGHDNKNYKKNVDVS